MPAYQVESIMLNVMCFLSNLYSKYGIDVSIPQMRRLSLIKFR